MSDISFASSVANEMIERMKAIKNAEIAKQHMEDLTKITLQNALDKVTIIIENALLWDVLILINFFNNSSKIGEFFDSNTTLSKLKVNFINQLKQIKIVDAVKTNGSNIHFPVNELSTEDKMNIAFSVFDFRSFYVKENIKDLAKSKLLENIMDVFLELGENEITVLKERIFEQFTDEEKKRIDNEKKLKSTVSGRVRLFLKNSSDGIKQISMFKNLNT